jgi:hypothetical protein
VRLSNSERIASPLTDKLALHSLSLAAGPLAKINIDFLHHRVQNQSPTDMRQLTLIDQMKLKSRILLEPKEFQSSVLRTDHPLPELLRRGHCAMDTFVAFITAISEVRHFPPVLPI